MRTLSILAALAAAAALGFVVATHWADVSAAVTRIPLWAFTLATALHVVTLAARSEAWRVVLTAITGTPLPRTTLHSVNAGAFIAGAAQSHAALPVRIGLLTRVARGKAPRAAQIATADVPIVVLEVVCIAALLAVASLAVDPWWLGPGALAGALALLVGLRLMHVRFGHLSLAQGMDVLGHERLRGSLLALVATITALMGARVWLLLEVTGLPATFSSVALLLASLGAFGFLPLGPSASPGATLATFGAAGVAPALALGLAVSATSICAVLVYALLAGAILAIGRAGPSAAGAEPHAARTPGSRRSNSSATVRSTASGENGASSSDARAA